LGPVGTTIEFHQCIPALLTMFRFSANTSAVGDAAPLSESTRVQYAN
jgi:hypothetical protein